MQRKQSTVIIKMCRYDRMVVNNVIAVGIEAPCVLQYVVTSAGKTMYNTGDKFITP
jgi:hypothetical protein